jgi:MFS family permease
MPSFSFFGKSNSRLFTCYLLMSSPLSNNLASQERRAGLSLALIYAFRMLGLFMILPVFALYAEHYPGATPLMMGLALGIYGLTQALLQIPFGMWSDRIGRKPVIFIGLLIFAVGSLIAGSATTIEGIIIGRAIQGGGAIASALMALAADLSREEHRTKMMALIGVSIGISFAASMVLGPIVNDLIGISGIFFSTAVLAMVGVAILYFFVPDPVRSYFHRDAEVETQSLLSVMKDSQLIRLDIGIFALHFILMCIFLVMPLILLNDFSVAADKHWQIYLPVFAASLVIMVPFIIIAERKQVMKPVFNGAIISLVIATSVFLSSHSLWSLVFGLVIFFAGFNLLEASLPSLITKVAPATQKGTAMGMYSSSQFMGAFAGGAVGGYAHQSWGIPGVFYTVLIVLTFWLLLALTMKKPGSLSTYLLNVRDVTVEQLLAVEGVVEAALIEEQPVVDWVDDKDADNRPLTVAYLKVKKRILDEEKLLSLAASDRA